MSAQLRVDVLYLQRRLAQPSLRRLEPWRCVVADKLFAVLLGGLFMIAGVDKVPDLGRLCHDNVILIA